MAPRVPLHQIWAGLVSAGALGSAVLTAHSLVNLRLMRRPSATPGPVTEPVSVLLPVRDEVAHAGPCLESLSAQTRVDDLEILVLDDGSTDGTAAVLAASASRDPRIRVLTGSPPPPGWLGKPHACHQLSAAARGSILVFVDADVRFEPHAIAAAAGLLRTHRLSLVSPYPRQLAGTVAERLVQPLLQWSWLTTLPLRIAERSPRASMAAANGQFMAVDAEAYRRAGGHAAIRDQVLDDLALLREIKQHNGTGGVADGTALAACRMYEGWPQLREGYRKSLWTAFGSPAGAAATMGVLAVLYIVPPLAAVAGPGRRTRLIGVAGQLAAAAGRFAIARRTRGHAVPDPLAHPASIAVLAWLTASSVRGRRRGTLAWRGRSIVPLKAS